MKINIKILSPQEKHEIEMKDGESLSIFNKDEKGNKIEPEEFMIQIKPWKYPEPLKIELIVHPGKMILKRNPL